MSTSSKRRNSEKRKEKSRDAARCRRSRECEVFHELCNQLPVPHAMASQLDKASIMRLAISHLRIQQILKDRQNENQICEEATDKDELFPKALNGFVVVIAENGDLVYISDAVSQYLGIQQVDLIGQNMQDFVDPRDLKDFSDLMELKPHKAEVTNGVEKEISFLLRMKCTLTAKGRSVNLKSAAYKVIRFTGQLVHGNEASESASSSDVEMRPVFSEDMEEEEEGQGRGQVTSYFLGIGEPIPHPSQMDMPLDGKTFKSRHNMDMTFTVCDDRLKALLGYSSDDLIGNSIFSYHHAQDSHFIEQAYKDLFTKGQTVTEPYRMLAKYGGYVWVITQGTVIYNNRSQKAQGVECIHFVLSEVEDNAVILSDVQKSPVKQEISLMPFKLSTENVLEPKTDFNMDFYIPPEKMRSDNPTELLDLTHLAPTAGDACIPLPVPLSPDGVTEEVDISTIAKLVENDEDIEKLKHKPFSLSDFKFLNDDVPSSMQLEFPNGLDVDQMDKFFSSFDPALTKSLTPEDLKMEIRAPYIPMNPDDDFSLLPPTRDDLFNSINEDFNPGLFGRTEYVFTNKDKLFPEPPQKQRLSLRDMLEGSTAVASIERPLDKANLKIKRVFDKNALEKGPPAQKIPRTCVVRPSPAPIAQDQPNNKSVLLNLLLTGEDRANGYNLHDILKNKKQDIQTQACHQRPQQHKIHCLQQQQQQHHEQMINQQNALSTKAAPSFRRTLGPNTGQFNMAVRDPSRDLLLQGEELLKALDFM